MRKFKHLAQLSDAELKDCLFFVQKVLDHLEKQELTKDVVIEYRHQQAVLRVLKQHASYRHHTFYCLK